MFGLNLNNKLINPETDKTIMYLAYIICKDNNEAEKIATHLLKKSLIACANMFPIKSMYWWSYRIARENETVVIAKTTGKNFKKVESEAKKIHSYKIPCIMRLDAKANKEYESWINSELKNK